MESMQINGENMTLTLREVVDRHGGEVWYQRERAAHRAFFRFVLPVAVPGEEEMQQEEREVAGGRPEYYDFDLFNFQETSIDLDRKLTELAYTVFDTETTGLEPSNGDEIIQLISGAVDFILRGPDGERRVELRGRAFCIVPRGVWHRTVVHAPAELVFTTWGLGTQHEPIDARS
jgi:hypothetical protein